MELVVIGDEDTRTGFKLAGVTRTYPGDEANIHLEEMLQDDTIGIIMINEKFAEENREVLNRARKEKKRLTPIIVEISDNTGPIKREIDPLQELIRRALGAQIEEEE
ncbi:MAG: V-type ATP synthase subunit F [Deltaproteobacteria bacterium]|nr:V-type ATP synthase subunit F [Deltaproteobacteria bacterium]